MIAVALAIGAPTAATANTFNDSEGGADYLTTSTTLNYTKAHGDFNLRVWTVKNAGLLNWTIDGRYSIKMYDRWTNLLWSAGNQSDRTYFIGGNVTKITIQRNNRTASQVTTHWKRQ